MSHLELVVHKAQVTRVDARRMRKVTVDGCALAYARRRLHNGFALAVGDALALSLSVLIAVLVSYRITGTGGVPFWGWALIPGWWLAAAFMRLLPSWDLLPVEEIRRTTVMLASMFGLTAAALFLLRDDLVSSRPTVVVGFALAAILLPAVRSHVRTALRHGENWGVSTVIYGAGSTGRNVIKLLQRERGLGYNPVGLLDDNPQYWGCTVEGLRVLGATDYVTPNAEVAILAMPGIGRSRRRDLLRGPLSRYRKVFVLPDAFEVPAPWMRPRRGTGVLGIDLSSNLSSPVAQHVKRLADVVFVLVTAVAWLPLCTLLALSIRLETRAHPFYRQARVGRGGKTFGAWSFRTTVADAEAVLRASLAEDPDLRMEWETRYRLRKDPRVSRVGRLLRWGSLDRLPQILNVLRGDMSIVGPRPLPAHHHDELSDDVRNARERVRPGITGLCRVSGEGNPETEEAAQWDAYYFRNWSIWLDLVVVIRTIRGLSRRSRFV